MVRFTLRQCTYFRTVADLGEWPYPSSPLTPLTEVVAVTDPNNAASQNVLRKSGLIDTGARRAYCRDLPGFAITKDQWRAGQAA